MGLILRQHRRLKSGKYHVYWSLVENRRCGDGRVVQRHVLYLGALSDSQRASWEKTAESFYKKNSPGTQSLPGLETDRELLLKEAQAIPLRLSEFRIHRPRQWGACWIALKLWNILKLSEFWEQHLRISRQGTRWLNVFITLVAYRLIDPGSEWRLHRDWFDRSAMADLLGEDFKLAAKDRLYRCLDLLTQHKEALFKHLQGRWKDEFNVGFDVLLYDLTSTYFESDPPFPPDDKRRYGYSRDKRSDCVQVIIALVVTPEGYPLAYEVLPGNTADKTTLRMFLKKIEELYGKARRVWVMDRGIPTEEVIEEMQASDPVVHYLVGTPKGRLSKLEKQLVEKPWAQAREHVRVKLLALESETYVFVESQDRLHKERSMRLRKMRVLIHRLKELQRTKRPMTRDELLVAIGQAKEKAGRVFGLMELDLPQPGEEVNAITFRYRLRRDKYRQTFRREGRYLLRTNLTNTDPKELWEYYLQLVSVEAAFKNLKGDLQIRPIHHQKESRIEAHIFVCYIAYCLQVTLQGKLRSVSGGLSARSVLEKFATMEMMNVHFPTQQGDKELVFRRYTQPEKDHKMLLAQLGWELPEQPPPLLTSQREVRI